MNTKTFLHHLKEAALQKPAHPDAWYHLGLVSASLERHSDAVRSFDKALEFNPHYVDADIARCFSLAELESVAAGIR